MFIFYRCNGLYQIEVKPRGHVVRRVQRRMVEHTRYAYITNMSGDQMMYAAQASQCVYILRNGQLVAMADIIRGGDLNQVDGKLLIAFGQYEAYKFERYYQIGINECIVRTLVDFGVKYSYFNDLRRSLDSLSDDAIAKIMPTSEHFSTGLDLTRVSRSQYSLMELDKEYQFRALQLVLFSRSIAPVVIPGPFGTGKTRVLAVAAYNFIEYAKQNNSVCRVLVCCHHQVSADTFVETYFGPMSKDKRASWEVGLVRLTSKVYFSSHSDYEHLYVPVDLFKQKVKAGWYDSIKHLVVVTTFITALNTGDVFDPNFFTHILLDEGAQVREPEAVAPLCMANRNTKIVIAGDPQQVSKNTVMQ